MRSSDPGLFAQAAAIFDNFGQSPVPVTNLPHRAKKTNVRTETLLETKGTLCMVAKLPTPSPLRAASFLEGKNLLFTLTADGGLLKHTVKPSNWSVVADPRLKQGLFPHVGEVAGARSCVFASDCTRLFLASGSGVRCVDTTSGAEKWHVWGEVRAGVVSDA